MGLKREIIWHAQVRIADDKGSDHRYRACVEARFSGRFILHAHHLAPLVEGIVASIGPAETKHAILRSYRVHFHIFRPVVSGVASLSEGCGGEVECRAGCHEWTDPSACSGVCALSEVRGSTPQPKPHDRNKSFHEGRLAELSHGSTGPRDAGHEFVNAASRFAIGRTEFVTIISCSIRQ